MIQMGLSIYKFIEALLNTANSQLGNVNKLKLRITNQTFTETEFSAEGEANSIEVSMELEKEMLQVLIK